MIQLYDHTTTADHGEAFQWISMCWTQAHHYKFLPDITLPASEWKFTHLNFYCITSY